MLLPDACSLIESRLGEIDAERERLEAFLTVASGPKPRPARRPRRGPWGYRPAQFLTEVEKNPGATATDIAKELGITTNHAYGIAKRLLQDGKVKKVGRSYEPVPS